MGHKYSTVYQHNTNASYQYNTTVTQSADDDVSNTICRLGDKCFLYEKYPYRKKCKMCYTTIHQQPVLMLFCGNFNHKYHTKCISKFINQKNNFKCHDCKDIIDTINQITDI